MYTNVLRCYERHDDFDLHLHLKQYGCVWQDISTDPQNPWRTSQKTCSGKIGCTAGCCVGTYSIISTKQWSDAFCFEEFTWICRRLKQRTLHFYSNSGFLVAYLTLKAMADQGGKMNWKLFYFHRYWRWDEYTLFPMCLLFYLCIYEEKLNHALT